MMIAALPGREETAFEYGWRADLVLAGLVTCGGCGGDLTPDMTVGVITFACPDDGCGLVRIAARVLVPAVVEQLRTAPRPLCCWRLRIAVEPSSCRRTRRAWRAGGRARTRTRRRSCLLFGKASPVWGR
ncbi:hypothetical protein [Nonomuraea sp. NPDC003709]|uniref:hypothetical protein n=1 Tax=Nonomuraea sp. NPDC003709 TaxID=3154450 RepID=UPI0033B4FE5C